MHVYMQLKTKFLRVYITLLTYNYNNNDNNYHFKSK